MFDLITQYVNIPYIIAVVFVTEALKKYFPKIQCGYKKWLTIMVAFCLLLAFVAWELVLGNKAEIVPFAQRIFLSFPGVVTFYSYLVKPLIDKFTSKTPGDDTPATE